MKWERTDENQNSKTPNIKSIHHLFNDSKWRPDDQLVDDKLAEHPFINFKDIMC